MKELIFISLCLGWVTVVGSSQAADLKQSRVTQVVNDVRIISAVSQTQMPAAVNDLFKMPDQLHTGPASRAELVAADNTVTRVGANTIFSFDPANRTIDLQQGSLLFHSPHGQGGGTIHTGSATASVLGTTLIVTTTPNGGMKVLDLEGDVDVKFRNGLKQRLTSGQMTFILPGGNQLAPIIIFRLDLLTKNSLLVKGFDHPLASLPLIQNQIDRQNKLIKSGRASDTRLDVGDTASRYQVEVLDPNTIQTRVSSSPVLNALQADATITSSSLADPSIPIPPARIFLNPTFQLAGNSFFAGQSFSGFAGRDISFTPSGTRTLDLGPFASSAEFDLVAANNMNINSPLTFSGLSAANKLSLVAGNSLSLSPGITVQANAGDLELSAPTALTLDNVQLLNAAGKMGFNFGSDLTLQNGSALQAGEIYLATSTGNLVLDASTLTTGGQLTFNGSKSINVNNSRLNASDVTCNGSGTASVGVNNSLLNLAGGALTIANANQVVVNNSIIIGGKSMNIQGRSVSVSDTIIQTHLLTLNSGDGILLDAHGKIVTLTGTGIGATANFTAPNLVTVNNVDMRSFPNVNMAAHTINLFNVAFGSGSSVTLQSFNGVLAPNPNTGAASVPGDVNFIRYVTYGGQPAQNYVNNGGGITIGKLP